MSNEDIQKQLLSLESKYENQTESLHRVIESQQNEIKQLHVKVAHLENHINKRQVLPKIGFTAYLDHTINTGPDQTIVFNKVITNEGSAYNIYTGVFTCPVSGLYLFSFTVCTRNENQMWAHLVKNNEVLVEAVADGFHGGQDMQGGVSAVLRLQLGDVVYIKTYNSNYHVDAELIRSNTFTGVLLY